MRVARFGKRNAKPLLYLRSGRILASDDGVGKGTTNYSQGQKSAAKSQAGSSKKLPGTIFRKKSHSFPLPKWGMRLGPRLRYRTIDGVSCEKTIAGPIWNCAEVNYSARKARIDYRPA